VSSGCAGLKTGGRNAGSAKGCLLTLQKPRAASNGGTPGGHPHDGARICCGFCGLENEKSLGRLIATAKNAQRRPQCRAPRLTHGRFKRRKYCFEDSNSPTNKLVVADPVGILVPMQQAASHLEDEDHDGGEPFRRWSGSIQSHFELTR
jgi:hypothetical protein